MAIDSATMRVRTEILDYLEHCSDTTHAPVSDDAQAALKRAVDSIGDGRDSDEVSPGQRSALEAADSVVGDITFEGNEGLSPGERAAQEI